MIHRNQVPITAEVANKVLAAVENRGVLVGGQALAVWISIFDLDDYRSGTAPISIDADFLGDGSLLTRISKEIPGSHATAQLKSAISRLIGVVEIPLAHDKFMSIDVIDAVPPLTEEHVFQRAISLPTPDGKKFLVLHPVDLLTSRAYNLRKFDEKQNENGVEQLAMALRVVHAYLSWALKNGGTERQVLNIIEEIVRLAKSPNGATAKAYGIDFLAAMPFELVRSDLFHTIRRAQIIQELADVRAPSYLGDRTNLLTGREEAPAPPVLDATPAPGDASQ